MKRILLYINPDKWYHIKTLEKFYPDYRIIPEVHEGAANTYKLIIFKKGWRELPFLEHPKTKKLKVADGKSFEEIGIY